MKTICVLVVLLFLAGPRTEAQWSGVDSGTTSSLRGVFLLDSGVGYAVGEAGTILKSTDAGMTWNALASGTTKALYDVYFFNDNEGLSVGDGGFILRTTNGGATWPAVTSGVRDSFAPSPLAAPTGSAAASRRTSFTRVTPARAGASRRTDFSAAAFSASRC